MLFCRSILNSQAKGPRNDRTLESCVCSTEGAVGRFRLPKSLRFKKTERKALRGVFFASCLLFKFCNLRLE